MDDESLLEARLAELGLAVTQALPASTTITPLTLAANGSVTRAPTEASSDERLTVLLPRLSLRPARELGPGASPGHDYALVKTLGEGGMGRVHLARQLSLGREVAIKTLKPDVMPGASEALLREARLTGALEHPGVIPVHAVGLDEHGHPVLVMKRVDGVELSTLLRDDAHPMWRTRGSPDRLAASIEILIQVCLTLEFAHSRGVLHRDIKPDNIMVGAFGEVYVLDWGIASTLDNPRDETIVGTPAYMAPELALGRKVGVRTDVYLLGATLHEVLTGTARHDGPSVVDVLRAALKSRAVAYGPDVPERLAALCNRATALDPADRPESVGEIRQALLDFLRHRSARALCDTAVERLSLLEEMLASPNGPPADVAHAYRLATEARFGLTQSLREDALDPMTRQAMRRCLAAAIELELRQEHPDTADALLREMDPPDEHLARRIAETRLAVLERDRAGKRLARLERDLDPTVHGARRTVAIVSGAAALAVVVAVILTRFDPSTPSAGVAGAGAASLIIVGGRVGLRRLLVVNVFNQRLANMLVLLTLAVLANRILGMGMGTPRAQTISIDLLIVTVVVLAMAIALVPRLAWCTPVLVVALTATRIWPRHGPAIFGGACIAGFLVAAAILARLRASKPDRVAP